MTNLIISEPDQLIEVIKKSVKMALSEHEQEKQKEQNLKVLTINQVAKLLKKSHATVSKMVRDKVVASTRDGMIPEKELMKYIEGQ